MWLTASRPHFLSGGSCWGFLRPGHAGDDITTQELHPDCDWCRRGAALPDGPALWKVHQTCHSGAEGQVDPAHSGVRTHPQEKNDHDWIEPPPSFTPSLYGPESSTRLLPFATSVLLTLLLPLLEWHYPQSYCRKWAWSVTHLLYFYMRPAHSPRGHAYCRLLFFMFFFSSWASLQSTGSSCSLTPLSPDVDADAVLHHFISPPPFCGRVRRGRGVVMIRGQRSRCWSEGGEWNHVKCKCVESGTGNAHV